MKDEVFEKAVEIKRSIFDIEQKIMYYTKNNVYVFDLKDNFNLLPINKNFEHSVALLNENDKIIEKEYRVFETIINQTILL